MKLSLYNLSFRIPVYERSAPFSPLKHKSHYWSRKQSQILSERCTQFSRTLTSSNKGRTKKVVDIRLSFPCLRLTVETLRWILKYICTILTAFRKFLDMTNQGFRWNSNQFNGSLLRVIVEKIIQLMLLAKTEVPDSHNLENHWCIEHARTQLCQLLITRQKVESNQSWQSVAS